MVKFFCKSGKESLRWQICPPSAHTTLISSLPLKRTVLSPVTKEMHKCSSSPPAVEKFVYSFFFIQIKQRWYRFCCKIIRLLSERRAAFGEKAAKKEGIREPCGHVETKKGFLTVRRQSKPWALISPQDKALLWHAEEEFPDGLLTDCPSPMDRQPCQSTRARGVWRSGKYGNGSVANRS